jgi:response regulator RpfG family c-di-GMP phosphodiesterase
MNEKNNFALVRKPLSAVEKTAPRAKRILSGIAADALVLARKKTLLKIVLIDDEPILLKMFEQLIRGWFKDVKLLQFENSREAWHELLQANPDLLITRDKMPGMTGEEIIRHLSAKNVSYPIIVNGGWPPTEQWVRKFAKKNLKITFLLSPFTSEQFYKELSKHFGSSLKNKI